VTVRTQSNKTQQQTFKQICDQLHAKPVLIELPNGEFPSQMMTASYFKGDMYKAHLEAFRLSHCFIKEGFEILRTKIEAMCSTQGVPETEEDAEKMSRSNYFEFHIKLDLSHHQTSNLSQLNHICSTHNAHLSRNAFKVTETGNQERFVTMRMYFIGKKTAMARYEACLAALSQGGFNITSKQREYAVYDSNVGLDAGWIENKNLLEKKDVAS